MAEEPRRRLVLDPGRGDPELGRWLAALEDARRDTLLRDVHRQTFPGAG